MPLYAKLEKGGYTPEGEGIITMRVREELRRLELGINGAEQRGCEIETSSVDSGGQQQQVETRVRSWH